MAGEARDRAIVERALAKINLTLEIAGRRPDGLSELSTLVAFADVGERLSLEPGATTGLAVRGPGAAAIGAAGNLVLVADHAFRDIFPDAAPPVAYGLVKEIPVAAGLGGGSADAAAALRGLARLAGIDANEPRLAVVAAGIGADVAMCLTSRAALATGIGEIVCPLGAPPSYAALLVNPGRPLATGEVFKCFWRDAGTLGPHREEAARPGDAESLGTAILSGRNDLEAAARLLEPAVGEVLDLIAGTRGVVVSRMTGSGATCFGLYGTGEEAERARAGIASARPGWWARVAGLC